MKEKAGWIKLPRAKISYSWKKAWDNAHDTYSPPAEVTATSPQRIYEDPEKWELYERFYNLTQKAEAANG